jgi:hypothetical protein
MTEHKGKKNTISNFLYLSETLANYFLKKRDRIEIMILISIMVVIGMYTFRLGLSMTISPGKRPMGNFPSHGQRSPTAKNTIPSRINVFCITLNTNQLKET